MSNKHRWAPQTNWYRYDGEWHHVEVKLSTLNGAPYQLVYLDGEHVGGWLV